MSIPADPRWDRLPHLFAGELADDEVAALQRWIDDIPGRREQVERLRELWQLTAAFRNWNVEAGVVAVRRRTVGESGRIIARVGAEVKVPQQPKRHQGRRWLGLAAAAVLALATGGVAVWRLDIPSMGHTSPSQKYDEYKTMAGQRLMVRLQDSTVVTLAPASTLRQPSSYGHHDRTLYLDGEAAFVVKHDAARPFTVHTTRAVTRDLGTRFMIRAYAADPAMEVVVAEGMVDVWYPSSSAISPAMSREDSAITLTPGERVILGADGSMAVARDIPLEPYFGWIDGRLVFQDTPLTDVARQLARWYDVKIRVSDSLTATRRLTATFRDEPVSDVLYRIATTLALDVEQVGRAFTLQAR